MGNNGNFIYYNNEGADYSDITATREAKRKISDFQAQQLAINGLKHVIGNR